ALHAHLLVVAKTGRTMVRQNRTRRDRPWRVHFGARSQAKAHALHPSVQPAAETGEVEVLRSITPNQFGFSCYSPLVFERYFGGPDEVPGLFFGTRVKNVVFNADTLHDVKSVSKIVASLAIGIAIDRGLIRSVNEPIFSFFSECADLRSPEKNRIQLVHVLTMTMGLDWVEATPATGENNDESRMHRAADPSRYVLGLASTSPPGHEFFYNTGALTLASAIVHKATGRPLDVFARDVLFEPLGIADVEWTRVKGDTDAGGGLRLRPRDMAKIGQ